MATVQLKNIKKVYPTIRGESKAPKKKKKGAEEIPPEKRTKLQVTEEGVVVKTGDELVTVPADSVILSVGYVPDDRFAAWRDGKTRPRNGPETYFIGDCDRVGSLKTVVKQAYELVQQISYR